jgi:hypothetical protein
VQGGSGFSDAIHTISTRNNVIQFISVVPDLKGLRDDIRRQQSHLDPQLEADLFASSTRHQTLYLWKSFVSFAFSVLGPFCERG